MFSYNSNTLLTLQMPKCNMCLKTIIPCIIVYRSQLYVVNITIFVPLSYINFTRNVSEIFTFV